MMEKNKPVVSNNFNNIAAKLYVFALNTAKKLDGQYDENRKENFMFNAFQYAYLTAENDDEESIRNRLNHILTHDEGNEMIGYDFFGAFTVDEVMGMAEKLPEKVKENLHQNRDAVQSGQDRTEWEEKFYNSSRIFKDHKNIQDEPTEEFEPTG